MAQHQHQQPPPAAVVAKFVSVEDGSQTGPLVEMSSDTDIPQLTQLINRLLDNPDPSPYSFFINNNDLELQPNESLATNAAKAAYANIASGGGGGGGIPSSSSSSSSVSSSLSEEHVLTIKYVPQAVFRVRPITRSTSTLAGHADSVLHVQFSPNASQLASCSGDRTLRIWDIMTQTPRFVCSGHADWVLTLSWSPDGAFVASGSKDGDIRLWNANTGKLAQQLRGHSHFVTSLAWEPLCSNFTCRRLASASKDGSIKVWDTPVARCLATFGGHTQAVTCLRWGGNGFIFSGSRDKNVNMYSAQTLVLQDSLKGHAHWVNSLSLSTDFVLRTGPYDHNFHPYSSAEEGSRLARARYQSFFSKNSENAERLASASDDGTLILWCPEKSLKPIARLTGHQKQIMFVNFSPDGRFIASASYDKSIRLWDGFSGKFLATMRGHVGAVYQLAWSPDSRMLVSGSKDSMLKLWDLVTKKCKGNLPGHADEVFSVDWSPDGQTVCSGSFDRTLKLWRH